METHSSTLVLGFFNGWDETWQSRVDNKKVKEREREADTPWFMQKTNKVLDTGLASLTKVPGAVSRESQKPGQESEQDQSLRSKESAEEREKEKERKKDTGTQALMEQRCFNDFSLCI